MSTRNYPEPKVVCNFGINDSTEPVKVEGKHIPSYDAWRGMMRRCYDEKYKERNRNTAYRGCLMDERWKYYSAFKAWFEDPENGYHPGYTVDKDVLVHGNKVYSPDTCIMLPPELNSLFVLQRKHRGKYPMGVYYNKKLNKFSASVQGREEGQQAYIGIYPTIEEAFMAYKKEKEAIIKRRAKEYYSRGLISRKAYDAMMNYEILITD